MKIFTKQTCLEASIDRIRYFFEEFDDVIVGFSGGKDSTVTLNLALIVAREKNALPLKVLFIDQEVEWTENINYVRGIMNRPDIKPIWLQCPLEISSGASHTETHLQCWEEGAEWVREKEPNSIHENTFGTKNFAELFNRVVKTYTKGRGILLGGVRAEESPSRAVALTQLQTYKHITYGKKIDKEHFVFYPIYDWLYTDVWKAINDHSWDYCKIYDMMYQKGYKTQDMRISNLNHETAVSHLLFLQEIDRDLWNKAVKRLDGINTIKHLDRASMRVPDTLPEAFNSWLEFRDYLASSLLSGEGEEKLKKIIVKMDEKYDGIKNEEYLHKIQIKAILLNDYHSTILKNWENSPEVVSWRKFKKNGQLPPVKNKFIHG